MADFKPLRNIVNINEEDDSGWTPLRDISVGQAPKRNALSAGLSSGTDVLQGLGYSALGGAADLAGLDSARDWANEQARRNSIDASINGRPDLERIEDQTAGSALPYLGYQVAKQVPIMAGLTAAQFVPGLNTAVDAAGLTRLGATLPKFVGGGGLEAGASFAARKAALEQGRALATGTVAGSGLGFGSMYGESVEGGDPNALKALALAPIYGAAEAVLPAVLQGGLRVPTNFAGNRAMRMLKAGGVAGAGESLTELGQNEMEMGMRNDLTPEQKYSQRLNSAAAGLFVGGTLGSSGGFADRMAAGKEADLMPNANPPAEPATPQYGLVTQPAPLQTRINEQLGIGAPRAAGKKYASQFEAAYNEPSGQYAQDPATGIERELTMGELMQRGNTPMDLTVANPAGAAAVNASTAKAARDPRAVELRDTFGVIPTPQSLQLYSEIQASGVPVDSDLLAPVWAYAGERHMTPKRLEKAQLMLDAAIIQARKGTPNVSTTPTALSQPATGVGTGGAVVQGSMGATGPSTARAVQPSTGAVIAGTPAGQAQPVSTTGGQQAAPVTQGLTNGSQAPQAKQTETQGQEPSAADAAVTAAQQRVEDELVRVFGPRDAAIMYDALAEGMDTADIATKHGLGRSRVSQMAGLGAEGQAFRRSKFAAAGGSEQTLRTLLTELTEATRARQESQNVVVDEVSLDKDLMDAGLGTASSMGGAQGNWKDTASKGSRVKSRRIVLQLAELKDALAVAQDGNDQARADELEEQIKEIESRYVSPEERAAGLTQEAYEIAQKMDALQAKIYAAREAGQTTIAMKDGKQSLSQAEDQVAAYKAKITIKLKQNAMMLSMAKNLQKELEGPVVKAEDGVSEKEKAALTKAKKERDAQLNKDRKGLAVGDTVVNPKLGTGKVLSFSGNGAETFVKVEFLNGQTKDLSVQAAKLEKTTAGQANGGAEVRTAQEQYEKVTAGFPAPAWTDLTADQQDKLSDLTARDQLNLAAVNRITAADGMKFGEGKETKVKTPYTAKELLADIKAFVRSDIPGRKLMVVDSITELLSSNDRNIRAVGVALQLQGAYGVATDGRAFLVANRINKGDGRATFMHEVGAHLGLENLLPKAVYDKLTGQIEKWVNSDADTDEAILAARAEMRVMSAGTVAEDIASERLAYFIEEAMLAGIDPTAAGKESAALTSWFRTLWAAFKVAIRKLGLRPDSLTAQDVVDMAFGAARLELSGTFHGTAATFRNFSNKFIGTGEGATAYGWGTYLAQSAGIAKGYWKADVRRKTVEADPTNPAQAVQNFFGFGKLVKPEGSLMRVDTAVSDDQVFDYDSPISKQPKPVRDVMQRLLEPLSDEIVDRTNKDLEDLTGRDLFGTGERDLGLLSNLIMDDVIVEGGPEFDKAVRAGEYHKAASLFLEDNGIQGIKFKDANSRGSNLNTITFDGKAYNKEDLREERRKAFAEKRDADTRKFLLLDSILRFGLTDTQAELEAKIKQRADMFFDTSMDSAARFNVKVDEVQERADANKKANETYEGQQLNWLKANVSKIDFAQKAPTRNLVVFNDKNIFRVGGQVSADRQRMKFGTPAQGAVDRNISKLPKGAQQPVRNMLAAIGDVTGKGLDYLVFTSDLVNRAVKAGIPSAKNFVDLISKSKAEARENEIAVEKIADMYALVPEKERGTGMDSVNRFLFDSTREAKWGYGQYRDAEMGDRFDALSPESQAFVEAVFDHGTTVLAQKKKVVLDSTNSEYDAMIAIARASGDTAAESKLINEKKATIKRFQTLFKIRDGMPYAPIKRNGSHVVIAKSQEYLDAEAAGDAKKIAELESNGDHYHVSFTDGKWEGRTLQQQLIDQGAFADVQIAERDTAVDEMFSGHSALRELTKMRSRVDEQAKDGDKSASKMLSLISQMYLEALAEGSARKSEMRRRGVEGEVDMIRSFAQQGRADANFMASVKYNPQVQDALQEMRTQSKTGDRARKSELFNELAKRYVQSMDYSPRPWLNKLTRMSSIYYLATSPAYYLQNLTQPWMMSVPAMAGQHDYTAASGALFKAYTELGGVMKSAKLLKQQFDFDKVPADVRDAIKELVNRGKIDIGLDTEIGEFKVEGDGYFAGKISAADKALRLAVQKVESINRLSTAMAAYRLELARTKGDKQAATDYADRILTETHGDYTSFNAPRAFNTSVGKVALQFRKFQLIQLAFYAKLIKESLSGADRKAALKTLGYSLGHTGLLAGLMGMPGYAAISWAIGALLGDDDEPYDVTAEIRKAIGDEAVANLVLRGAPTVAGMDISGKVGAGNMLSIMPFSQADLATTAGRAEALGTLVGGASLGMTSRMVDGLGLMLGGDWYRGIEQTMPKGVSDAMKAYRIANEGLTRRNGDVVLPASEVSAMDSLFQAIGISPVQQTVTYERQNAVKTLTDTFQARTTEIKNQYVKAERQNDTEAKAQARAEWNKLQEAKARNGVPRAPLSNLLKAPAEQRKRERETVGGIPYTKATKNLAKQYSEI